jgi:hypothetical protein
MGGWAAEKPFSGTILLDRSKGTFRGDQIAGEIRFFFGAQSGRPGA